jgi:hypothetical protein
MLVALPDPLNIGRRFFPNRAARRPVNYDSKHFSFDHVELCTKIFQSKKRTWWAEKRKNREGETCCLLHDLAEIFERDRPSSKEGLQILAWWLYDHKHFDLEATLIMDVDFLHEYKKFGALWSLRKSIGRQVYVLMYIYFHSLCFQDLELNWAIEEMADAGLFLRETMATTPIPRNLELRAAALEGVMVAYLGRRAEL